MSQYYIIYQEVELKDGKIELNKIQYLEKFTGEFQALKQLRQVAEREITKKEGTNHTNFYHDDPLYIKYNQEFKNSLYLVPCKTDIKEETSESEEDEINKYPSGIWMYKKQGESGYFTSTLEIIQVGKFSVSIIPKMSTEITNTYIQVPVSDRNTHTTKIPKASHDLFSKELIQVIASGNPFEGRVLQRYSFNNKKNQRKNEELVTSLDEE